MVYIAPEIKKIESKTDISSFLDPGLLRSAQNIYYTYCKFHQKLKTTPIGVAIDRKTHRGQLIFCKQPVLLPWENFIPIDKLESNDD